MIVKSSASAIAIAMTTALLVSACGFAGKESPSMNFSDARDKINEILDDTTGAIKPPLKWWDVSTDITEEMTTLNNPSGKVTVSRERIIRTKFSQEKIGALLGVVERHWKKRGYSIDSVNSSRLPSISAVTPDGYGVDIRVGVGRAVTFSAVIDGVKDPGEHPFTDETYPPIPRHSDGYPNTVPDTDDSFWSH